MKIYNRRTCLLLAVLLSVVIPAEMTFRHFVSLLSAQEAKPESQSDSKQKVQPETNALPPRQLEIADVKDWQHLQGLTWAPTADWYGYALLPNEGDGQIFLKQYKGTKVHKFKVGPGSGSIQFSHDGKWAAFRLAPLDKEAKAAAKKKEPVENKLILVELESGKKTEFERIERFDFSEENPHWLAMKKNRPKEQPSGDAGWSGTDLLLKDLRGETLLNFGNISGFAFNKQGKWLALTIDAQHQTGNGLLLLDPETSRLRTLDNSKAEYRHLKWTREGDALVVLKGTKQDGFEGSGYEALGFRDFDANQPTKLHVVPEKDAGIPEDMTISPNRAPEWTEDRSGLLFGIHEYKKKETKAAQTADQGDKEAKPQDNDDVAELVVWHWQDERLQSQQQVQESRDKNFSYLCVRLAGSDKSLQIGTEEMRDVQIAPPHRFAIATDDDKYQRDGTLDGRNYRDVYVIELATGKRRLALEQYRWITVPSPAGDHFLYYKDKHYHVYNVTTGESRAVTEGVPTSFVNTEDDHNVVDPPIFPLGWSVDGGSVLLYDNWDLWRVPIAGGPATNLTVNGKAEGIRYARRYRLDPDEKGIDFGQPLYISAYGERTKKQGIGRIMPGQPGIETLLWDDCVYSFLNKVKDHDVYYFTRESSQNSPEYFAGGPDLKEHQVLTESNLQQKNFYWSDGVRLVDYNSTRGDSLQAALHLPANYVEGKKYPTIVYIYEKLSQNLNRYNAPRVGGFSSSIFTSQGYAVLMPDIVYQVNDPGGSAGACVLPALDAAIASGVVDPEHVGLHGHSWGGYQTAFLITQTDRFQAAIAGAPLTNMISMYSSIYWNSGSANQPIFESSQGRFTGGYWTNIEAYTKNSPVYFADKVTTPLLLLHNDKDGAVDWNQGIEYFNTLRRLNKPVVLLQYTGENHGLAKLPNKKDYSYRMLQFFDHYLKDGKAPDWWSEGISHLEMKKHIKNLREERESRVNQ